MKKAIIIGATGFGGLGLIDILHRHPGIVISQLIARKDIGQRIDNVFPHLKGYQEMIISGPGDIALSGVDIAFFSTPDRAGMTMIKDFYDKGIPVIDFSGDFRFGSVEVYSSYAKLKGMEDKHLSPEILKHSVYGLPEIYADKIKTSKIIGNPGCFAISMILGLMPAVEADIIDSDTIICDGKTGVSGAGKNPGEANYYPQRYEKVNTYKEGRHQHIYEVENVLNSRCNKSIKILFVPQIVPLNRGILTTMYANTMKKNNTARVIEIYNEYYKNKPFIIITDKSPNTTDVRGTNRCVIRPMVDERTGILFITSVIDNLIKGQSGNAVQIANILLGFNEQTGLDTPAFYP